MVVSDQGRDRKPLTEFIYEERKPDDPLRQGDLLARTDDLNRILLPVQLPDMLRDCRALLVITQTCDLIAREGRYPAKYICLAVVERAAEAVLEEVAHQQTDEERQHDLLDHRRRADADKFLDRLLNNNEPGMFFLHEDLIAGVQEHLCAFLPITVSVEANPDHYQTCVNARLVGIKDVFQAKLGWLIGIVYSRVGTKDLRDFLPPQDYAALKTTLVKENLLSYHERDLKPLLASLSGEPLTEGESIEDRAKSLGLPTSRKKQILGMAERVMRTCQPNIGLSDEGIQRLLQALEQDPEITRSLK